MREAASKPNVTILQSNGFEGHYALHWRGVDWSSAPLLYPAGLGGRPSLLRALGGGVGRGAGDPTQEGGRGEGEKLQQTPGLYGGHSGESFPAEESVSDTVLIPDRGVVSGSCPSAGKNQSSGKSAP